MCARSSATQQYIISMHTRHVAIMDDIHALNSKLQSISKNLDSYQAAVLLQEEQIRKLSRERTERKELHGTLLRELEDVEKEYKAVCSTEEKICATTTALKLDKELVQNSVTYIPQLIRKVCIDYERFSKRKGKVLAGLRRTLLDNQFWDAKMDEAMRETSAFRRILREALSSQAEFAASEQGRLQGVLEVEEMKLAYLNECLKDFTESTPARRITPPQDRIAKRAYTVPIAATAPAPSVAKTNSSDPFADWEDRPSTPDPAGRMSDHSTIGGYRYRYTARSGAGQAAEQSGSEEDGAESAHSSPLHTRTTSRVQEGRAANVTISTSTVTERIVTTTTTHGVGISHSDIATNHEGSPRSARSTSAFLSYDDDAVEALPAQPNTGAARGAHILTQALGPVFDGSTATSTWPAQHGLAAVPDVPWFRQIKRRRLCASSSIGESAVKSMSRGPSQQSAWPTSTSSLYAGRYDVAPQLFPIRPDVGGGTAGVSGMVEGELPRPPLREPAVVDLYDTSDDDDQRAPTPRNTNHQEDPRGTGRNHAQQSRQTSHTRGISKESATPWQERFRTGLDLINASSRSTDCR